MCSGIIAVVPAAGRGSRLGFAGPKLLAPLGPNITIWTVMREKLLAVADSIVVILSPDGAEQFVPVLAHDPERERIKVAIQEKPTGMAPAVAAGKEIWKQASSVLVIWGDQVHVLPETLTGLLARHAENSTPKVTMPIVEVDAPYVQYVFDDRKRLLEVRETREGHKVDARGYSDVGTFLLENQDLDTLLERYIEESPQSKVTAEINFLPFFVWLSKKGWRVEGWPISEPEQARGINDHNDLEYFQKLYSVLPGV